MAAFLEYLMKPKTTASPHEFVMRVPEKASKDMMIFQVDTIPL